MSGFGFKRPVAGGEMDNPKSLDVAGLPSGPVLLDPARERDAIQRGEALGFTDRGQGGQEQGRGARRKRPPAPPTRPIYIRAPEDLADWFDRYTEQRGHRALWQSIQDFREMIDAENNSSIGKNKR